LQLKNTEKKARKNKNLPNKESKKQTKKERKKGRKNRSKNEKETNPRQAKSNNEINK
jgi:hypothetical protein